MKGKLMPPTFDMGEVYPDGTVRQPSCHGEPMIDDGYRGGHGKQYRCAECSFTATICFGECRDD